MKVYVLAWIVVVPVGVTILSGLCNPPRRAINSQLSYWGFVIHLAEA
jgi:hypothetical protein